MRLFIAIKIPQEIKDNLSVVQEQIRNDTAKIKWVNKEQMHLTLKFLGEVQPNITEKVKKELKKINFEPFSVYLDSIGIFPSEDYIRVIWVGLKPEDTINELRNGIDESLKEFFPRQKNFNVHLTLGRVKFVKDKDKFIKNLRKIKIENKKINVNGFKLMKSTLSQKGPIYEEISSYA